MQSLRITCLDLHKHGSQETHLVIARPIRRRPLPQILLVGGVRGEALRRGRDHRRLGLVRDRRQVERLGVPLELLELGGAFEGHEAPRGRRVVGHEGRVLVLPKVHRRVVARGRPNDDGEDFHERLRGVERRPPGRILLVEMSHRADLGPPLLELLVPADGLVTCQWD